MGSTGQSPINRRYLISITTPQKLDLSTRTVKEELRLGGLVTFPLPSMVPILESERRPSAPVTGLLPVCVEPLVPEKHLEFDSETGWIFWPVDSAGWFSQLAKALTQEGTPNRNGDQVLSPQCAGIPLAQSSGAEMIDMTAHIEGGWRSLILVCWNLEFLRERPWHHSVSWYPIWQRRLKRAPKVTNINK